MAEMIVENYLGQIEHELYGMDARGKASILSELEDHIRERAFEEAKVHGLEQPSTETYLNVISKMGEPEEIAREYMQISTDNVPMDRVYPQENTNGTRKMIYLVGIIAIIMGLFFIALKEESVTYNPSYSHYTTHPYIGWGFVLLIAGILVLAYGRWMYDNR